MGKLLDWKNWKFKRWGITLETRWGSAEGGAWEPYQTLLSVGQLRLHCFHRGDGDPDPHDHMWDFWTFPLTSYVEKVWEPPNGDGQLGLIRERIVKSFRVHSRRAELRHLVVGRFDYAVTGYRLHETYKIPWPVNVVTHKPGRIWTIVWVGKKRRDWGFWKFQAHPELPSIFNESRGRFIPWREYIYGDKT